MRCSSFIRTLIYTILTRWHSLTVCTHVTSFLDGMATRSEPLSGLNGDMRGAPAVISSGRSQSENSFDLLLREAQAKLHKRKA